MYFLIDMNTFRVKKICCLLNGFHLFIITGIFKTTQILHFVGDVYDIRDELIIKYLDYFLFVIEMKLTNILHWSEQLEELCWGIRILEVVFYLFERKR